MSDHEEFNVEHNDLSEVDGIEPESTMPVGVDGFGSDSGDLNYGAGGSAVASKGWMVIVTVIVLAAGGLFAMHSLAKVTAGDGGDAVVDGRIEEFLSQLGGKGGKGRGATAGQLVSDHDIIVKILADDYSQLQVPLKEVQFNPFAINRDASPAATAIDDPNADAERRLQKQREKRRIEIERACDSIGLKSVMMGKIPLANISGQIVRLNELLAIDGVDFKVATITKDRVKLTAKDAKLNIMVDVILELEIDR